MTYQTVFSALAPVLGTSVLMYAGAVVELLPGIPASSAAVPHFILHTMTILHVNLIMSFACLKPSCFLLLFIITKN